MIVIDKETKQPWSQENVRRKGEQVRQRCIDDLCARDVSRGVNPPGMVWDVVNPATGETRMNYDKIRAMHTGKDFDLLFAKRMAEFASEPQDEKLFVSEVRETHCADVLNRVRDAAREVEDSLEQLRPSSGPAGKIRERRGPSVPDGHG